MAGEEAPDWVIEETVKRFLARDGVTLEQIIQLAGSIKDQARRTQVLKLSYTTFKDELNNRAVPLWASEVFEFSSQFSTSGYSAEQVLGEPSLEVCGDNMGSWAQRNNKREWVKVGFGETVVPLKVSVHQNNAVGFVRSITLWNADGTSTEIKVEDTTEECPGILEVMTQDHLQPIKAITVTLDGQHKSGYEEIDAISIVGVPVGD
jgi:hypothetical protein